jgi:hypothetical protein
MPVPLFFGYVFDICRRNAPDPILQISDYGVDFEVVTIDVIFHELTDGDFGTHHHWVA